MLRVEKYAQIRIAYYVEGKSMRQIGRETGHGYWMIRKVVEQAEPKGYQLSEERESPVLGPYHEQIEKLLAENERLPRKQRYTSKKIYQIIQQAGYRGAESSVRRYVGMRRKEQNRPTVYLPLRFDPGMDAQMDWGEAQVVMDGVDVVVQLFVMRLCYSRRLFVMAFPNTRQEAFFWGHVCAFAHFGGIPRRIIYDNLKTAVKQILEGRNREEQTHFLRFRSHYLFETRFCTPAQGHEKGGVESDVGYSRRNFLVPIPHVANFDELNGLLLAACQQDAQRTIDRSDQTIDRQWQAERPLLQPLPTHAFLCCISREVTLNGYGQVTFETNRYSVPATQARKHLTLRAYPFTVEVLAEHEVIATHKRCYGRQQDVLDPLHYLKLVGERPGAFEHALPLRQWREQWPPAYERLLATLRQQHDNESNAIRTFVQILTLHQSYDSALVEAAITQAVQENLTTPAGVRFCLDRLLDPTPVVSPLDLSQQPTLASVGQQAVSVVRYNQFLKGATP